MDGPGGSSLREPLLTGEGQSPLAGLGARVSAATERSPSSHRHSLHPEPSLRVYAARWRVLGIYCACAFVNQAIWLSFAPTAAEVAARFNVPLLAITSLNTSAAALFVPGAWLCARALAAVGLRRTVVLAACAQAVGALVRCVADGLVRETVSRRAAFAVLSTGQALASLAAPVFLNLPPVIAEAWFDPSGREFAQAVGTISSLLGQGAGSALAGSLISGARADGTFQLLFAQAALASALALSAYVGFESAPPTPPSRAAEASAARERGGSRSTLQLSASAASLSTRALADPIAGLDADPDDSGARGAGSPLAIWRALLCRPQFLLLLLAFNVGLGIAAAIMTLLGQMVEKCGYGPAIAGDASGLFMLAGAAGAFVAARVLDRTRAYKATLRAVALGSSCSGALFMRAIRPGARAELLVCAALLGAWTVAALPVLIANAVEEAYPAPPDAPTALLFTSSNVLQVAFTFVLQLLLTAQGDECGDLASPSRALIVGAAGVGCLLPVLAFDGAQNRRIAEEAAELERRVANEYGLG
ncbi:hypothetical protein KFE25_014160 [Diacronema lutheri]|uniref:Major facilitator superfamily (MFS) profile domain-containing protein n=3 Tax=Diacronema lutheri TaxID=2081491 RepID=A0A8J5XA09_DIALT|nr:hypothetical protein KFE25_014160 [Diacronema lutheri]